MEKISLTPKMSKIDLNSMSFEILLSTRGKRFRARCSSLSKIANIKETRPEATSQYSYENAIQKLIPKIENALSTTTKQLGKLFQNNDGKIFFSVENIIYKSVNNINSSPSDNLPQIVSVIIEGLKNIPSLQLNTNSSQSLSNVITNTIEKSNSLTLIEENNQIIKFSSIILEWLQSLHKRTKKTYEDEEYLSPTTLESYSRYVHTMIFPYLEKHSESDNIFTFSEDNIDEILNISKCRDTQKILLLVIKSSFNYAIEKNYIKINPFKDKKLKKKKQKKSNSSYDFIEEDDRALWLNCFIKEINSKQYEKTDAPIAFLFTLLHGTRPEETCGTKWIDLDFEKKNFFVHNAFKDVPIYDNETMKRIGWNKQDGPLKTPESYRHIPLDFLAKKLLLEHKEKQKKLYKEKGKKWSENEYVFHNNSNTPFTPKNLSKNFTKFVRRNNLPHIVLYGLRHSFATHCRNLGMTPEVLARLMGHTEYETTQKYYIHISAKQKREELEKVQQKDLQNYLGNENKNLTHLQKNINQYNKKLNLKEVQKEDLTQYLKLNDETLIILKRLILEITQKEKIIA